MLAKMPFRVRGGIEGERRVLPQSRVGGDSSRFFLPLLHDRGIVHDLDLALIVLKTHAPTEALLIKRTQFRLVGMVIRWTKQRSTGPAPRDRRKVAFDWFALQNVSLVKFGLTQPKSVRFEKISIG